MNYAVLNSENIIVNVVVYNGIDAWAPPASHTIVEIPQDSDAAIGWSHIAGEFVAPEPEPEPEDSVDSEERI